MRVVEPIDEPKTSAGGFRTSIIPPGGAALSIGMVVWYGMYVRTSML